MLSSGEVSHKINCPSSRLRLQVRLTIQQKNTCSRLCNCTLSLWLMHCFCFNFLVLHQPTTWGNWHGCWRLTWCDPQIFMSSSLVWLFGLLPTPILWAHVFPFPSSPLLPTTQHNTEVSNSSHCKLLSHEFVSNLQKSIADEKTMRGWLIIRPMVNRFLQASVLSVQQFYYLSHKL